MFTPLRTSGSPPLPIRRVSARQRLLAVHGHELAGDHQAPGGGVDEQGLRAAHVRLQSPRDTAVADQRVTRGAVGNTQQRFGQAHQRHAFLAGQREFLDQALDAAASALAAQLLHQVGGHGADLVQVRHAGLAQQQRHAFRLGPAIGGRDGGAQHRLRLHILAELVERRRDDGLAFASLVLGALFAAQVRHLGGQVAALDPVQIGEDRLLVQPMRRAVELCAAALRRSRSASSTLTPRVVLAIRDCFLSHGKGHQAPAGARKMVGPYANQVATRQILRLTLG